MKILLICLAIFVSSNSFGQQIKTDSTKIVDVKDEIKVEDLVLKCGYGLISKEDKVFEKKYNLKYQILLCNSTVMAPIIAHNIKIIKILDDKYGNEWRAFARQDIIGIKIK